MKKTPLIIGGTVLTLGLIGGGIFAFQALGNRSEIEVIPVSYVSTSWWGDYNESSGYVSSDMVARSEVTRSKGCSRNSS